MPNDSVPVYLRILLMKHLLQCSRRGVPSLSGSPPFQDEAQSKACCTNNNPMVLQTLPWIFPGWAGGEKLTLRHCCSSSLTPAAACTIAQLVSLLVVRTRRGDCLERVPRGPTAAYDLKLCACSSLPYKHVQYFWVPVDSPEIGQPLSATNKLR